jgi:hypothetical protein
MRVLIALALLFVAAEVAEAGPIRARLAARRGCSSCQQPRGVAFRPAGAPTTAIPAVSSSVTGNCANGRCAPLIPFGTLPTGR